MAESNRRSFESHCNSKNSFNPEYRFLLVTHNSQAISQWLYEGGSESSVIGVITLLIDIIGCCIMP